MASLKVEAVKTLLRDVEISEEDLNVIKATVDQLLFAKHNGRERERLLALPRGKKFADLISQSEFHDCDVKVSNLWMSKCGNGTVRIASENQRHSFPLIFVTPEAKVIPCIKGAIIADEVVKFASFLYPHMKFNRIFCSDSEHSDSDSDSDSED